MRSLGLLLPLAHHAEITKKEMKVKRAFIMMVPIILVAACGGGGSGGTSGDAVSVDATPLRVFSDGSGVGSVRAVSGEEVTTGYILTPELASVLEELEAADEVTPFDANLVPVVGSGPNTQIRQGAVTIEGVSINVIGAITDAEDATLVLLEDPASGASILLSEGIEATERPIASSRMVNSCGLPRLTGPVTSSGVP
jgi:hypothetical protein